MCQGRGSLAELLWDPGYSFLNNDLLTSSSVSDVSSASGRCTTTLRERPLCSPGGPKGLLPYGSSLITLTAQQVPMLMPFRHRLTDSGDAAALADIPKQTPCPHISGIWVPCRLLQDNGLCCSNSYLWQSVQGLGYQTLQISLWWKLLVCHLHFCHLYLSIPLLTEFSILNNTNS